MPGNELGDGVHNFFAQDNLSQEQHHSQIVEGNRPVLNNNFWVGSQRKFDLSHSDSKNYGSHISGRGIGQGNYALHASHGSNFDQTTARPSFAKSQYQSEQPNLNVYTYENRVHQTKVIEANSVTVDADSDQHLLTASRGLSIHEFQKGSGLEHQAKTSLSSEAISPLSFDLFGGQQPMSFQQSSMLRSLQHQQSGINDMQQVQQEAFIKKMQELQRQQQLDLKQRNLFNQISPFAKQASGSQSSLNNDTPNSEASHYAWMVDHGNANWLHHASSGLAFNPNLGQTRRLADLVPQQVDQSLYGVPVSSSRGVAVNQYSQMGKDRSPMMQMSTNSNSLPGQYTGLQDQISVQGRALISGQRFQNEKIGHTSSQALSTGINMEILQQVNPMQRNTPQQDFWGRQELSVPQEASTEKPTKQVASSRNDGALDPMEEKILFGSDDNVWAALGKSNNMSDETVNLFDSGGLLDGVPSLQSGSWSALMQSAAAETSSSDMGLQDEWSGLIYNNAEVPSGNKHPSMYNNHGKQEVSLVGDNVRLPSTMSSGSAAPCDATNTNNQYQNFMGFNHFGPKFQGGPRQRLQPEKSQRPVSLEEEGKWSGSSSLQRVAEGSQMYRNASQPSLDVEKNAKSISTPLVHEHSGAGQLPNNCNNSSALSYGGDRVVNDREIGNLSQNSQSNPIKAIHEAADYRRSSWTLNSAPSSTVELGSPQVNKGGWSLNDAALVPNSVTTRVDEETSPFVQNNYLFQQQKNANSLVKSPGGDGLGRMLHQVNEGNKEEIARHETKNYDLMDNSNDSRQSNLSQHTSAGFMGRGMSDASDSQSLAPGKQKSITEPGHKASGTHKFQYHPMGNLDEDIEPSYGFKQPTHVQRMSSQNNDFELSKFLGQVPKNSIVVEKGQSSDLQIDGKNPDEGPSLENQSGYGRSVDTHTSNKASPSSQNMLDLLHKVDQSRDQGIVRHFDSSNGSGPSQLPEAENWDGLVGRLQNTQSSVSPGFGLQLGPPSQRIHKPDRLLSSQNAQHAFDSLHFSRTAGEIGEKDQNMASTPSVQSFPLSNEQSLVEFENNKSGSPRQYGTEASLYKIPANFSSALNSSFPYPGSHFQNQQITRTQGQRSQPIDLSSKNNASQSILKGSAEAFSPDVSGSVAHDNLASLEGMSQRTGTNDPRERGKAAMMSANDHVPASQPFSRSDIFQHGAAAQLLRNMWANVPTNKNTLGAPYHTVSSNFFQSPLPNIVESSTSIPLAQGDHDVRKERNFPSEFGAIPTNSRCVSGEEETLKERFNQQLGKSASINHLSDDSPANSASTQKDIEAFGQSLKPNSFSHQNFSLLNQKRAMKDAETDPNNRVSKKIKGPDNGLTVHQVALNTRQSNEHGTFLVDSLGSSTTVSSGDGGILSFSKPADFLESNISSQHGNIATKLGFGPDVSQSNYLSDTRVEQPHVSPQTAPSWFNQYGTFKNGQMPHTVTSFRTAEPSFPLSKSSGNFHALSLMEHGTTNAVNTCQVGRIFNSAPTSVATGPNKQKNDTSKLHPWHKEISQGSQNLQIHSLAAVEWAKAANCLTEKVEDDVEFIEDGPPIHRSKRRLVMTTQLMQRLFRPPSAAVFSADASLNYDSVAYSVSRMALGDACSAVSCSINSNMACNGINLLAAEGTPSSKNGDKHFAEVIEELMGRMKKLENEFLRCLPFDFLLESQGNCPISFKETGDRCLKNETALSCLY
ncbi:uncharacterized protein LOC111401772 [Olea europaea var. sylvestris]|uniref:uncharacterized protein LOC111401772 n=1 Tax=Olea europaea var. sylvestris TaxID=158386 RepID=UPI000C1D278E|nr:uncharacterized protein LOC111401772 [Olea europaea var. sylvestris]